MASSDSFDEAAAQIIEVLNIDRHDHDMIVQALKRAYEHPYNSLSGLLAKETQFRTKYQKLWDDSMFNADRDGANNNAGISFHVESSDHDVIQGVTPPPDSRSFGAPSRPPSRSNNRSPLGMMVDWTAAHVPGVPSSQAEEDDDIQRAIRESAQEAGITMPQHESGITGPSEPAPVVFGPAKRETYNESNWAMVPTGPSKESSPNEVLPSKRKRDPGAPVMLINSGVHGGHHCLGGLLTIMHEIPIARNILLGIGTPAATYGHSNDWWRGQEILSQEVLAKMAQATTWDHGEHKSDSAFDEEVHRLMAFLDSTERAYGSVSVLADLLAPPYSTGMEKQFYEMLGQKHSDSIQPLMQVAALAMFHGDDLEEDVKFGLLEMEHLRNDYRFIKTLYEALDHVIWSDTLGWDKIHEGSKMAFFKEMGEVLVLNTTGDGPEDSIEIPQEFYPEKYLTSRKDEARRIQRGWCQTKEEVARISSEKEQLYRLKETWDSGNIDDKRELLRKTADQWGEYKNYLETFARFRTLENSGFDTNKYPDYRTAPPDVDDITHKQHETVVDVIDYSEKLLADLETRMQGLDAELEQIMAKQRALGRLLTVPDKPDRPKPFTCKKYLLRGVVTGPGIVYVCQREEADLIEFDGEGSKDQWWKLSFTPNGDQAVHTEKIEIEDVFKGMWEETKKPLLVYATEDALETPKTRLSSQLERFVKAENKAFRQELSQEDSTAEEAKRTPAFEPVSPSKRKHRSDSGDSMDSNRASIGSDNRNGFDNPFPDHNEAVGTEMTDYSNKSDLASSFNAYQANGTPPPWLPAQTQASTEPRTEPASATMTPSTVGTDYIDSAMSAAEGSHSPEMQEKAKPPPFISLSRNPSEQKESINLMDMDIPDEKQ
ncbi:uncharacterized protein QYS62_007207 [Fusarium acuminatum]|uniref:Ubiquitin interaction domain-containing protein n=1 Tax=Fusarium acuminatum TaxID=5515 RepID=A0ABZ2WZA6_9HYPO